MTLTTRRDSTFVVIAAQIRAARGLIGWSQTQLAEASGLSLPTIKRMEGPIGPGRSTALNLATVVHALEMAGVDFTNGAAPGVRLKPKPGFIRPEELTTETDW